MVSILYFLRDNKYAGDDSAADTCGSICFVARLKVQIALYFSRIFLFFVSFSYCAIP